MSARARFTMNTFPTVRKGWCVEREKSMCKCGTIVRKIIKTDVSKCNANLLSYWSVQTFEKGVLLSKRRPYINCFPPKGTWMQLVLGQMPCDVDERQNEPKIKSPCKLNLVKMAVRRIFSEFNPQKPTYISSTKWHSAPSQEQNEQKLKSSGT